MTGKKVQVIDVGVGGLLVRQALAHSSAALTSTSAWYSLDAPHKGLNFGKGVDSRLVFRCGGYGQEVWRRYTRVTPNPFVANPLDFNAPECSCGRNVNRNDETIGKDPSQWTCVSSSQAHDSYFSGLGWPAAGVPHFAVSYGDVYNHALIGTDDTLINVSFTFPPILNCPYSGTRITGWKRDCVAGSGYLTKADTNNESDVQGFVVLGTSLNAGLCGKRKIDLDYQPAFVNVDSALAADTEPVPTAGRSNCGYDYSMPLNNVTVTHWTDWAGNASNWDHRVLSDYLACKLLGWMNNIDHGAAQPDCGLPPTVVSGQ